MQVWLYFRFPLGCAWWRSCWPSAASSSAMKPCSSGRASLASGSPTRSAAAFPGLMTDGILMLHPGNFGRDLMKMPFVANPGKAATDLIGEPLAEFACPLPHGFVADDDAAGGQQLLHHAQPEREAEVEPDGMADDLGREAIPGVAGASGRRHPTRLLTPACRRKHGKAR